MFAGLPDTIPAYTVNKVCGSGLKAVMLAAQAIKAGDAEVVAAGGFESMSLAPHLLERSRTGLKYGDGKLVDALIRDGLWCAFEDWAMGEAAEYIASKCGVSRADQDRFSAQSHKRAAAAWESGAFAAEVVPVTVGSGAKARSVTKDEGSGGLDAEGLGKLRPAFKPDGTVTAGNASQLSDGAAAVVVASERPREAASRRVNRCLCHQRVAPKDFIPLSAVRMALDKARLGVKDIDLFELNEASLADAGVQPGAGARRGEGERERRGDRPGPPGSGASGARVPDDAGPRPRGPRQASGYVASLLPWRERGGDGGGTGMTSAERGVRGMRSEKPRSRNSYPTADGRAFDSDIHRELVSDLIRTLKGRFAGDPQVYVSGWLMVFPFRGNKRRYVDPDVFVVKGVEDRLRDNYLGWEEGRGPDVVIELTSSRTRWRDTERKFRIYRDVLKVPEYFLFDPLDHYLESWLQGYRLVAGGVPADADDRWPVVEQGFTGRAVTRRDENSSCGL